MIPSDDILYAFVLPDWDPRHVTPFQGFAPGLLPMAPCMWALTRLPADLVELTMDEPSRLVRRRVGVGGWLWSPVNVETLLLHRKPTADQPLMVVFTADAAVAKRVSRWRRALRIRPLHVSIVPGNGAIRPEDLTVERLGRHCLLALAQAQRTSRRLQIGHLLSLLGDWRPFMPRLASLRLHSHNVTLPNEMTLASVGEAHAEGEGELRASPEEDYVNAIAESAQAVLVLQASLGEAPIHLIDPPRPDVILFAPAAYRGVAARMRRASSLPPAARRTLTALDRQTGYTITLQGDAGDMPDIGLVLQPRGMELKLQSYAVGLRAAGTMAATIRMRPAVNRTAGVVDQLAHHLRAPGGGPRDVKTARVFKVVQDALLANVPPAHLSMIAASETGVKIVGDAPLEWLPVEGLPLGIAKDVSRINATPGNILIEQLRPVPPIYLPAAGFKDYLVASMFEDADGIGEHVLAGLEALPGAEGVRLTGSRATPRGVDEFIEVVNAYEGSILVVDSHGSHPVNPDVGASSSAGRTWMSGD